MNYNLSLTELQSMPTLSTGQADDLKYEDQDTRVWLSRCTVLDGEPYNHKVTVEKYLDGRWYTYRTYQAASNIDPVVAYLGEQIENTQLGSPDYKVYAGLIEHCKRGIGVDELEVIINANIKQLQDTSMRIPVMQLVAAQQIALYSVIKVKIKGGN